MRFMFPDDDGKKQRAWITDSEERGRSSCERVKRMLNACPWVGDIVETIKNGDHDRCGVDIYIQIEEKLARAIGVWESGQMIPVQVKSSEHEQRKFGVAHHHEIFNLKKKIHFFVLDGQDAMDVITADMVGQIIVLACMTGKYYESEFLRFLKEEIGDGESLARFLENRELIVSEKWYGQLMERLSGLSKMD